VFDAYADWEGFAERLVRLGLADEYTRIWWDVRPHPRYGTIELRMPDQPSSLESSAAFATLFRALVAAVAEDGVASPADRGAYAQNRWAASRFGRDAELIHPDGERLVGVPELLSDLVELCADAAGGGRVGTAADHVAGLAQAEEQLELGRSAGPRAVCERLIALT
jgi:carboxylate-amine ligase